MGLVSWTLSSLSLDKNYGFGFYVSVEGMFIKACHDFFCLFLKVERYCWFSNEGSAVFSNTLKEMQEEANFAGTIFNQKKTNLSPVLPNLRWK